MTRRPTRILTSAALVAAAALTLSACSGTAPNRDVTKGDQGTPLRDATFTYPLQSDPGTLDPFKASIVPAIEIDTFLYASLVTVAHDGSVHSGLATAWKADTKRATFTLRKDLTCEDGSALTASDVAANISYIGDPKNLVPTLGTSVMSGTTAIGNNTDRTVTVSSGKPDAFLLQNIGRLPIVCGNVIRKPDDLAKGKGATGPYRIAENVANSQITLARRTDVTWAPDNWAKTARSMPKKIVIRVVPDASTRVNLLTAGELNAALVLGAESERAEKVASFGWPLKAPIGQFYYNEADGRITSDRSVRRALTQALDLPKLRKVLTAGKGTPSRSLITIPPLVCNYDSVTGNVANTDVAAAKRALDEAGWRTGSDGIRTKDGTRLQLSLLFINTAGETVGAAMELAADQWKKIGADVKLHAVSMDGLNEVLLGNRDWDISMVTLGGSLPSTLVPYFSGPVPPKGLNTGSVQNTEYEAAVAKAALRPGTDGCDDWKAAEAALFRNDDVVVYADQMVTYWGKNASFEADNTLNPWSIRVYQK